jgi:hypothetical protein
MIKKWSRWLDRETTLTIGETIYEGRVINELDVPRHTLSFYNLNPLNPNCYYFETEDGEYIGISKGSVRSLEKRLVWVSDESPRIYMGF